jgi:starch phosphorylase
VYKPTHISAPLTPMFSDVENLRFRHIYHPVSLEEKCPLLANVVKKISGGVFGDAHIYEP